MSHPLPLEETPLMRACGGLGKHTRLVGGPFCIPARENVSHNVNRLDGLVAKHRVIRQMMDKK